MTLLDPILRSPAAFQLRASLNATLEHEAVLRQQFRDWLPEGVKAEFINGERVIHVAVRRAHSDAVRRLLSILDAFKSARHLGHVGFEKNLVGLTRNDYEPDVCWWDAEKSSKFTDATTVYPAPDLVAEVLSPSTEASDRGVKLEDYAYHGIPEYWIVSPEDRTVEQYVLRNGGYVLHTKASNGLLRSPAIGGIEFPIEAIFSDDAHRDVLAKILAR